MSAARFLKHWWPTMLCVGVILYATLTPHPVEDVDFELIPYADKWIHAIMFGGFAGAIAFDWARYRGARALNRKCMAVFCLVAIIMGGVVELLQSAMAAGRSAELWDFAADSFGVLVAFFAAPPVIRAIFKRTPRK